jgi:hypothetical protein
MPVRKIPKNYLMVTGDFSSAKNGRSLGYESLLERDLMILLEFDDTVERFEEQPIQVPLQVNGKKLKPYVPDILIHFKVTSAGETPRPTLGEVKHTSDLLKNKEKYAPKFLAASLYAEERGWNWHIFSEKEIRTPYLDNLKFLREYHSVEPDAAWLHEVINFLQKKRGVVLLEVMLQHLCTDEDRTLRIVPAIWHLIATKRIVADLQKPLDVKTKLSLPKTLP